MMLTLSQILLRRPKVQLRLFFSTHFMPWTFLYALKFLNCHRHIYIRGNGHYLLNIVIANGFNITWLFWAYLNSQNFLFKKIMF